MIDPKLLLSVASSGPDAAEAIAQLLDSLTTMVRGAGQRAIAPPVRIAHAEAIGTLPPQIGPDRELLDEDDPEDDEPTACPAGVADGELLDHHANLLETIESIPGPVTKHSLIVQSGYLWGSPTRTMVDLLIRGGWIDRQQGGKLVRGRRETPTQRDPPSQ